MSNLHSICDYQKSYCGRLSQKVNVDPTKCTIHANRPELLTGPCSSFFDYDEQIVEFLMFFVEWTLRPDKMLEDLDKLIGLAPGEEPKPLPKMGEKYVKRFGRMVLEMLLVRGTDNFLTYLSQLLALIFTERPETLRSSETVRLEDILQHKTMEDLVKQLAERRVERLSYQGMKDLQKDLKEKLGFEIFPSSEALSRAVEIIEIRNLIVHNRGVVNRTFQARTGDSSTNINNRLRDAVRVTSDLDFLGHSVLDIDERAAQKFGLTRSASNPECKKLSE